VTAIFSRIRTATARQRRNKEDRRIYERFRRYTMIPVGDYVTNLRLAEEVREVPGCIVECGVWRGGMSAGMATVLGPERNYYMFDSFEGLPPAQPIDGPSAIAWQRNVDAPGYFNNCAAERSEAEQAMNLAGITDAKLIQGWFNDTIPGIRLPEPIALLRLDGDWYESTMVCLENLFDQVAPNGLIILDDYYTWDGCSRALHDFLSRRSATERIRSAGGTCFLLRSASVPRTSGTLSTTAREPLRETRC
jgi:O-methyltransferase